MSEEKDSVENLVDSAVDLTEAYRNLITIKIVEYTSLGVSVSLLWVALLIVASFVLLFTGLGSA